MTLSDENHCGAGEELLGAVLSGDATPRDSERLDAHLEVCPTCARTFRELADFRGRLIETYACEKPPVAVSAPRRSAYGERALRFLATAGLAATLLLAARLQMPGPAVSPVRVAIDTATAHDELSVFVSSEFENLNEEELIEYLSEDEMTEILEYVSDEMRGV